MRSSLICMVLIWGHGCAVKRGGDVELGVYVCRAPTQLAVDLTRAGVARGLVHQVEAAKKGHPGAEERVHAMLHTAVPVLRHLPLKRTVAINLEPAVEPSKVDSIGAPVFGLASDRRVRRSGYYDFFDKQIHATDGEQLTWTLVHEMAHALVDQHMNFAKLFQEAQSDTDRLLALGAVVEGDANMTAFAYARSLCDPDSILHATPAELDDLFELWWEFRPTPANVIGLSEGARTPAVKAHAGTHFVAHLTRHGGWAQLEAAYERPPLSTEHILHPEKYLDGKDPPWQVDLPELTALSDWDQLAEDSMGELRIRLLLEDYADRTGAASGWGGDTFRLYGSERGTTAVVWVSRWDSEAEAQEFADVFERLRTRRPSWIGLPMEHRVHSVVHRSGSDVTVLDGFAPWKAQALLVELQQTVFRIKRAGTGLSREPLELIRKKKRRGRALLDVMAIGARDCRVSIDEELLGHAPLVRAPVPRGWSTIHVVCADGHSYSAAHRLTRGRNILVIRHEDWQ